MNSKELLKITIILFVLAGLGFGVSYLFGNKPQSLMEKAAQNNAQSSKKLAPSSDKTKESTDTQVENSSESKKMSSLDKKTYKTKPALILKPNVDYKAVIKTSMGDVTVDLFEKKVPTTVNNFVFLAQEKFFDNTVFHRIIRGFMIQGGDPSGNGTGGPGYRFEDEPFDDEYTVGTIAMANAGPDTNGSQFFIMHKTYDLPKNYVIFGRATDEASLKVIEALGNAPVQPSDFGEMSSPVTPVTLNSVEILEN